MPEKMRGPPVTKRTCPATSTSSRTVPAAGFTPGDTFITWKAFAGGVVAMMAYGLVVVAYSFAPAGLVTAVRETSVVFAVLIGAAFLGEPLTIRRVAACLTVAAGAICVSL